MRLFLALIIVCAAAAAEARPVSYPGGWTVMSMNNVDINSLHVHYTLTPQYSVGWRHEYLRGPAANADTVQLNALLKRWNEKHSQANLYLKSGAGLAYKDDTIEPVVFTGLAADWETRRYFTSYENRFFEAGDIESFAKHKARLGIAPYVADTGALHTWAMVEFEYQPGEEDDFSVTPLVRLFKGPALLEAGVNLDKGLVLNGVYRF